MGRDEVDQCESCLQEAYARERHRCEAEMQKLRRMVEWLCEQLRGINDDLTGPPYCPSDECSCDCQLGCAECWRRAAEQAVAEEFSPKG